MKDENQEVDIISLAFDLFSPKYKSVYELGIKLAEDSPVLGQAIMGLSIVAAINNYPEQ